MRKPIIAGNWKMNTTPKQGEQLITQLKDLVRTDRAQIVVCPPYTSLTMASQMLSGSGIALGAQNMHWEPKGAFTGEIAPDMLLEIGVSFVILGHSERRQYFGETDQTVNQKAHAALQNGLTPIICVGETLAQREEGITEGWVRGQTLAALQGFSPDQVATLVIAYEPIWAIGTGRTATAEQADEVIGWIRQAVAKQFGQAAEQIRILYGGSMNASNASALMAMPQIDGGLIGGASLKAADFAAIANY